MVIRKAEQKDAAAVIALMKQLIDEHAALDEYYKPYAKYRGLKGYIADAIKNSEQLLLIAEVENKIVGYVLAAVEEAPFYSSERFIGIIADATVEKTIRRQGMLTQLFQEALNWFKQKGVSYIELSVDARNTAAIAAWRKLGFENYKLRLRRIL